MITQMKEAAEVSEPKREGGREVLGGGKGGEREIKGGGEERWRIWYWRERKGREVYGYHFWYLHKRRSALNVDLKM